MKTVLSALLIAGALAVSPPACYAGDSAPVTTSPAGTVGQKSGNDSYSVTFSDAAQVKPRDVYNVVRNGKTVGQAMILLVKNEGLVAVQMQGTLQPGDQLVFVRHDSVPTTPQQALDPSPNAKSVDVTGAKTPEWDKPTYNATGAQYPYAYADANVGYPVDPIYDGPFTTGAISYPGVYGGHVYAPHVGAGGFRR